jgi:cystathionine gamma-synthase
MPGKSITTPKPETIAAAHGVATDESFGAVAPPLYLSSTFEFEGYDTPRAFDYGRSGNPTRHMLEEALARLEGGAGAIVTSSGMSALDLLVGRLRPSEVIVAPHDCYGGSIRLLKARAERGHFSCRLVDQSNPRAVEAALAASPALVLIETPSNPLMRVIDIGSLAALAHAAGSEVVVDNTFLSPALQKPLTLGADYVLHSTTKYLNGHSDVIGGAVVVADSEKLEPLHAWSNTVGIAGSPFDAWLTLRGLRTLFPRMERQQRNATIIARYLDQHPLVAKVHYPGLVSHPSHKIAAHQQGGFGAMLSFELVGGVEAVRRFLAEVRHFTLAESLGGVESLVAHPATMTHADMGSEAREVAGITDALLRLSVGLEEEGDLIAGLDQGLKAAAARQREPSLGGHRK